METNTLVQTLETPKEPTGSSSEGTDPSWALFHLGARLIPPTWPAPFAKKPPDPSVPSGRGSAVPLPFPRQEASESPRPRSSAAGLVTSLGSLPPSGCRRRLPQSPAGCLGTPPPSGRRRLPQSAASSLGLSPPPSGRRLPQAVVSSVGSQRTLWSRRLWSRGLHGAAAMSALLAEPCLHQTCSVI